MPDAIRSHILPDQYPTITKIRSLVLWGRSYIDPFRKQRDDDTQEIGGTKTAGSTQTLEEKQYYLRLRLT